MFKRLRLRNAVFGGLVGLLAITSQLSLFDGWPAIAWFTMMALCIAWFPIAVSSMQGAAPGDPKVRGRQRNPSE